MGSPTKPEGVRSNAPALGHVSMMHDTLIANLPADDLRALVRALFAQGHPSNPSLFASLARARLSRPYSPRTPSDALLRAGCLSCAGQPLQALRLLALQVIPHGLDEADEKRADHDVVQVLQSLKESGLEGDAAREREAAQVLGQLRDALAEALERNRQDFAFPRALLAAFSYSPAFAPAPPMPPLPTPTASNSLSIVKSTHLPTFALGPFTPPRLFLGLWQLSSASWGTASEREVVHALKESVDKGYTAFDMADHYGDAELLLGIYRSTLQTPSSVLGATKWCVFRPMSITLDSVLSAVQERLSRLSARSVELLQFHWQDYSDKQYIPALQHLLTLREEGVIGAVGLCNFDSRTTEEVCEALPAGSIASNQIQFSLIDTRPLYAMCDLCEKHGVKLLTYGTLCGGFLSDKWVGRLEPDTYSSTITPSQRKYYDMILAWGGWSLFQDLLATLSGIAKKHRMSVANVATRWVLDQKAVGAVIIGARLGVSSNADDNHRVFEFALDEADREAIEAVLERSQGRRMWESIGDCGAEYR